ncbi:MAG: hypothetical protein KGL39_22390 [Patescibacteria group bacterium]|nr:hypothetical protein [Patescibacteria group bacterium]
MDENTLLVQTIVAFLSVQGIQLLKNAKWFPWLTERTKTVSRLVNLAVAAATTLGFTIRVTGDWSTGGQLLITFPAVHALMHVFFQWIMQETYYNAAVQKKAA